MWIPAYSRIGVLPNSNKNCIKSMSSQAAATPHLLLRMLQLLHLQQQLLLAGLVTATANFQVP